MASFSWYSPKSSSTMVEGTTMMIAVIANAMSALEWWALSIQSANLVGTLILVASLFFSFCTLCRKIPLNRICCCWYFTSINRDRNRAKEGEKEQIVTNFYFCGFFFLLFFLQNSVCTTQFQREREEVTPFSSLATAFCAWVCCSE